MTARGRIALVLAALLLAAAALALGGRWEGDRAVRRELREMRRVLDLVGPTLTARTLSAYRPAETFACLGYRTSKEEPYGLELCFDDEGRLVETIDRRGGGIRIGSCARKPVSVGDTSRALRAAAKALSRHGGRAPDQPPHSVLKPATSQRPPGLSRLDVYRGGASDSIGA